MSRPMNIDTTGWGQFDPENPTDAMCERERIAFTEYMIRRLKKASKTGSDLPAIWTGGIIAIVQAAYSSHENEPDDSVREALHQSIDFAWLQIGSMLLDPSSVN